MLHKLLDEYYFTGLESLYKGACTYLRPNLKITDLDDLFEILTKPTLTEYWVESSKPPLKIENLTPEDLQKLHGKYLSEIKLIVIKEIPHFTEEDFLDFQSFQSVKDIQFLHKFYMNLLGIDGSDIPEGLFWDEYKTRNDNLGFTNFGEEPELIEPEQVMPLFLNDPGPVEKNPIALSESFLQECREEIFQYQLLFGVVSRNILKMTFSEIDELKPLFKEKNLEVVFQATVKLREKYAR